MAAPSEADATVAAYLKRKGFADAPRGAAAESRGLSAEELGTKLKVESEAWQSGSILTYQHDENARTKYLDSFVAFRDVCCPGA